MLLLQDLQIRACMLRYSGAFDRTEWSPAMTVAEDPFLKRHLVTCVERHSIPICRSGALTLALGVDRIECLMTGSMLGAQSYQDASHMKLVPEPVGLLAEFPVATTPLPFVQPAAALRGWPWHDNLCWFHCGLWAFFVAPIYLCRQRATRTLLLTSPQGAELVGLLDHSWCLFVRALSQDGVTRNRYLSCRLVEFFWGGDRPRRAFVPDVGQYGTAGSILDWWVINRSDRLPAQLDRQSLVQLQLRRRLVCSSCGSQQAKPPVLVSQLTATAEELGNGMLTAASVTAALAVLLGRATTATCACPTCHSECSETTSVHLLPSTKMMCVRVDVQRGRANLPFGDGRLVCSGAALHLAAVTRGYNEHWATFFAVPQEQCSKWYKYDDQHRDGLCTPVQGLPIRSPSTMHFVFVSSEGD